MQRLAGKAAEFDMRIGEIVNRTILGVELFKDIISGRIIMGEIMGNLVNATLGLDDKVNYGIKFYTRSALPLV